MSAPTKPEPVLPDPNTYPRPDQAGDELALDLWKAGALLGAVFMVLLLLNGCSPASEVVADRQVDVGASVGSGVYVHSQREYNPDCPELLAAAAKLPADMRTEVVRNCARAQPVEIIAANNQSGSMAVKYDADTGKTEFSGDDVTVSDARADAARQILEAQAQALVSIVESEQETYRAAIQGGVTVMRAAIGAAFPPAAIVPSPSPTVTESALPPSAEAGPSP